MTSKEMVNLRQHEIELVKRGYNVAGIFLVGSQNYKLHTNESDVDSKAIIIPSLEDLIRNSTISETVHMENGEQCDVKDIRIMFNNLLKQNINYLELLYTNYKIINSKFHDSMISLISIADKISSYDHSRLLNCILGTICTKKKNIEKSLNYVNLNDDPLVIESKIFKEISHIYRLDEFINRFINGESFKDCLVSRKIDKLISIKNGIHDEKSNYDFIIKNGTYQVDALIERNKLLIDEYIDGKYLVDKDNQYIVDEMFYIIKYNAIKSMIK